MTYSMQSFSCSPVARASKGQPLPMGAHPPAVRLRPRSGGRLLVAVWLLIAASAVCSHRDGLAQNAEEALALRLADWQKVESAPETKAYREALRNGGPFDEARRKHLEEVILPQLARDTNSRIITKVRHRIPAIALRDAARNQQAYAGVAGAILRFMESLVRDANASLVARVNAAILIGELETADGKPLTESVRPLVGLATDPEMPPAVRVVSFSALGRFLEAVRQDAPLRDAIVNAGSSILGEFAKGPEAPPRPEAPAQPHDLPREWMAARAVDMLPQLLDELPAETATILTGIVQDDGGPFDLRVRSAVALGRLSTARSRVDIGVLVDAIGKLAAEMISLDEEIGSLYEIQQLLRSSGDPMAGGYAAMGPSPQAPPMAGPGDYFGGSAPGGGFEGGNFFGPGSIEGSGASPDGFAPTMAPPRRARDADSPPEQVFRRTSWRLLQLVRALEGADGTKGLAALGSDEETSRAKELARILLNGSDSLDETPDVATLRKLAAIVSPKQPQAPEATAGDSEDGTPTGQPKPTKPQPASPFDPFQ
jgi:hypothetical protein